MDKRIDNLILVECVNQYGREVIKPVCSTAQIFADMLGQKTLTLRDIGHIKALGFDVHQNINLRKF